MPYGSRMGALWKLYVRHVGAVGGRMDAVWKLYVRRIGAVWMLYGCSMGRRMRALCKRYGSIMGALWTPYECVMEALCAPHGSLIKPLGTFSGRLM